MILGIYPSPAVCTYSYLPGELFLLTFDILDVFLSFYSIIEFLLALNAFFSEKLIFDPPWIYDKVVFVVLFRGDRDDPYDMFFLISKYPKSLGARY